MPITMTCPVCNAMFRLADQLAGKQVRCQKCQQMFVVPMATIEDPAEATLVEPPPLPDEPTAAILMEPTLAPDEPAAATLVEPAPPPLPVSSAPLAPHTSSVGWALAGLACFFVALAGVGTVAGFWVANNLTPPSPLIFVQPRFAEPRLRGGFDKQEVRRPIGGVGGPMRRPVDLEPVMEVPPVEILALPLDANGRASLTGDILGGKQSYRVFLKAGKRYNFHVKRIDFAPRLQLHDGFQVVADKRGNQAVSLTYIPLRDAEFTLTILPQTRRLNGDFELKFGPDDIDKKKAADLPP